MVFAHPEFLILLLLVPAAGLFIAWSSKKRRQALDRLGQDQFIQRLTTNINWQGRRWQAALSLFALTLLIISIARPQWGTEVREIEQEGLQVMIALDVSQSMMAEDIKPNRLERAKLEIADLTERLDGDEVGLVLFSGASFIQVPLTSDYQTALAYLDSAGPHSISRPGTVIGDAISTALTGFDPDLSSRKVLIIMTDGEDRESDPVAMAQQAADEDVLIYTIGFGNTDGEPVPVTDANGNIVGYKEDEQGQLVLSMLDEQTLVNIAQIGRGKYYRASAGGQELDDLLSEIDDLQRAQLQSRFEVRHIERYQIFLGLAVLALVSSELIPERKQQKGLKRRTSVRLNRNQETRTSNSMVSS